MSLFTVDQEKCKKDGICAAECPVGIVKFENDGTVPFPADNADALCVNCGHCVAVCPHGAMSLATMPADRCIPVKKELNINAEQVEQFVLNRRSIRVYKDKPVDRDLLKKLIEIARYAPTGHNTQSAEWTVIYEKDKVHDLAAIVIDWMRWMIKEQPQIAAEYFMEVVVNAWEKDYDAVLRHAPHLLITHAHKDDPRGPKSCIIAATTFELAATGFGVGGCWAGYFNVCADVWPPMQKALPLPEGHIVPAALMVGHPKFKYHRIPLRNTPPIHWK